MRHPAVITRSSPAPLRAPLSLSSGPQLYDHWLGFTDTSWIPPSPQIAVGPRNLMATVNSNFRIFEKDGRRLVDQSARNWFVRPFDPTSDMEVVDPTVLYDEAARRFLMATVGYDDLDGAAWLFLSVSQDEDATNRWCVMAMRADTNNGQPTDLLALRPLLGVNGHAVAVALNMYSPEDGEFQYAKVRLLPKATYYDKSCTLPADLPGQDVWEFKNSDGSLVQDMVPAAGPELGNALHFVNAQPILGDALTMWTMTTVPGPLPVGNGPSQSVAGETWDVDPYLLPPDAVQPGTDRALLTGLASLGNAVWKDGMIWTAQTLACDWPGDAEERACLRWYGLDTVGAPSDRSLALDVGLPGTYLFYPAIAVGDAGTVVTYNEASASHFVSAEYLSVPNFADDTSALEAGTLQPGQGCFDDTTSDFVSSWGATSGIAWDASRGSMWLHGSHAVGDDPDCAFNTWQTRIGELVWPNLPAPTPTRQGPPGTVVATVVGPRPTLAAPTPPPPALPTLGPDCTAAIDLMLILDSSSSIVEAPGAVDDIRDFAQAVADTVRPRPLGARMGVVQFADRAVVEVGLTEDAAAIRRALDNMTNLGGGTSTDVGLRAAQLEFQLRGRSNTPQVAILISDGRSSDRNATVQAAQALRNAGIEVFAIGVGEEISVEELRLVASTPEITHVLFVDEFDELADLLDTLMVNVCPTPLASPTRARPTATRTVRPAPTATRRTVSRDGKAYLPIVLRDRSCPPVDLFADVVLVLDASTSMNQTTASGRKKYEVALDAATAFVDGMRLRLGGDQVGVVAFNSQDYRLQDLTSDGAAVRKALRVFTPIEKESRIELGVNSAFRELFSRRHNPKNQQAIVVLSDGEANPVPGDSAIQAANDAKDAGMVVFVVGIGPQMNEDVLRRMASDATRFFPAARAEALDAIFRGLVLKVACAPEIYWGRR